jgi:hypothetical protein
MNLNNEELKVLLNYLYNKPYSEVYQLVELVHKAIKRTQNMEAQSGSEDQEA